MINKTKTRILFVCLGNICRSPLAEAIFKHKIKEKHLEDFFEADSCGTANYHIGDPPDHRTIRNAEKNGVTINHLGRQLSAEDFDKFDRIFVMDESNYRNAIRLTHTEAQRSKVEMMRAYDTVGKGKDVPDPYHGIEKDFQEVFEILDRSMERLIVSLEKK